MHCAHSTSRAFLSVALTQILACLSASAQLLPNRGADFDGVDYTQNREWSGTLQWMSFYDHAESSMANVCVPTGSPCTAVESGDWTGRVEGAFFTESDRFGSSGTLLLGAELHLADGGTHNYGSAQGTVRQWDQFATTDSTVDFELLGELRLEATEGGSSYPELNGQVSVYFGIFAAVNGALVEELGSKCVSLASLSGSGSVLADGEPFYFKGELPADMVTNNHAVILYTRVHTTRTDTHEALPDDRALGFNKGGVIWSLNLGPRIFSDGFEGGDITQWLLEALNVPRNECDPLAGIWD